MEDDNIYVFPIVIPSHHLQLHVLLDTAAAVQLPWLTACWQFCPIRTIFQRMDLVIFRRLIFCEQVVYMQSKKLNGFNCFLLNILFLKIFICFILFDCWCA